MKRTIAVLGTLLTVVILFNGSALAATWHFVDKVQAYYNCTNPYEADGIPDYEHATLGCSSIILGLIVLDLGLGNEMGPNQCFTVFASSAVYETYEVTIFNDSSLPSWHYCGTGYDTQNCNFQTPSTPGMSWRFILIEGTSGEPYPGDPVYGPEIDAVGWYG